MEIIVNSSVSETKYTVNDLRSIFAMQYQIWPNGKKIHVFVLSDDDPLHREFTKTKLNMFPHQFRRIWDRLIFSGTGQGPRQVVSMEEMIKKIMTTPNSIGYADYEPINNKIRILK
jgi:ABC-type phosphate transport system substrate-binding protein